MASTGSTNSINDQAIRWTVEMAYGEMTPESRAELEAWLAADTRHRGAFVRARAWMRATEDAVVEVHSGSASSATAPPGAIPGNDNGNGRDEAEAPVLHVGLLRWSARAAVSVAALAACVVVTLSLGPSMLAAFQRPQFADTEVVKLQDGSIATLSADARLEIALLDDYRRITLISGEAAFNVATDKARPFVVRSGNVYAQATGTVYSVRRVGQTGGTVGVTEGSVLVWPNDDRDQAVLLHAGGMVTLDPGPDMPKPSPAPPRLPPPELAQISLDNESITSAVARFNRINSTKIIIADPAMGDVKIIGLYKANDPERFARAATAVTGGRIEYSPGSIVLKMK